MKVEVLQKQKETDDSVYQEEINKIKKSIDELEIKYIRLKEKLKRLERERNRNSSASSSTQTAQGYNEGF